jgi:hypothetical protein
VAWPLKHVLYDLLAPITIIHFLDDTLVDGFALTTKPRRKLERSPFGFRHNSKLLDYWFDELDGPGTGLDMMVIVMSILFNTVESVFKLIFAMRNKARILGFPSGVGCPFVVQHAVAQLIATTARLLSFTLREQTIARAERAAVRKIYHT